MDLQEIEINQDLHELFFEKAISPFVILDKNLNFLDVNQAAIRILNSNRKKIIGKNIVDVFPYLKNTERIKAYKNAIETGKPISFDDLSYKTEDRTYRFSIEVFKIGEGLGISAYDLTYLRNTMQKLKTSQSNLSSSNNNLKVKNQELEEMSYLVSHDLRAPLTNIQSLLNILEYDNAIVEEGLLVFEKIREVTTQMDAKLKAINKVNALKFDLTDKKSEVYFSDLLKNILANNSQEIIDTRTIIKTDFSASPSIKYDPIKLESVLHNLITNSIKYKHPKRKPSIKIKTKEVKGRIVLTIKDNGIGFDDSIDQSKIFELFKRMHTHVDGLGVGLYILNSIVTNNGGKIKVKSQINKGTEFKITF